MDPALIFSTSFGEGLKGIVWDLRAAGVLQDESASTKPRTDGLEIHKKSGTVFPWGKRLYAVMSFRYGMRTISESSFEALHFFLATRYPFCEVDLGPAQPLQ